MMAFRIFRLLFLSTTWLGCFISVAMSGHSEESEAGFLSIFAETLISIDGKTTLSVSDLGSYFLNDQNLLHLKSINKENLTDDQFRTKLIFSMFAQPKLSEQWELFSVSPTLAAMTGFRPGKAWLNAIEVESKINQFRSIANQQHNWGSLPVHVILQGRELLERYAFLNRIHSTFAIPDAISSYETNYLNWIGVQKFDLSAFQDKLEGIESYDDTAAENFENRYTSLKKWVSDRKPLAVDLIYTAQNDDSWAPIQIQLLHSFEEWFIPSSILDWAQLLDAANQNNWGAAIDKVRAIQSKQPPKLPVFERERFSFGNYLHFSFSLMFWMVQALGTVFALLFIGGVNRCYALSSLSLVLAVGFKWGGALFGINKGFSIPLFSLSSSAWLALLMILFVLSALIENRKTVGVMLLALVAIISIHPSEFTSILGQSVFAQLVPSFMIAGVVVAWVRVLQILFIRPGQNSPREWYRSIDRIFYPTIPLLLLSQLAYVCGVAILRIKEPTAPCIPLASIIIQAYVALQLVRYLILRWINQLSPLKAIFLFIGCLLLLSTLAASKENTTAAMSLPITIMIALGVVSLSLSYLVNLHWIDRHLQATP